MQLCSMMSWSNTYLSVWKCKASKRKDVVVHWWKFQMTSVASYPLLSSRAVVLAVCHLWLTWSQCTFLTNQQFAFALERACKELLFLKEEVCVRWTWKKCLSLLFGKLFFCLIFYIATVDCHQVLNFTLDWKKHVDNTQILCLTGATLDCQHQFSCSEKNGKQFLENHMLVDKTSIKVC